MRRRFLLPLSGLPLLALLAGGCSRPLSESERRGRDRIEHYGCGACHSVPGVPGAHSLVGPPLERMGRRSYIAGVLPNSEANLALFLMHPQQVHPGTAMPELGVSREEAADMARYLEQLR